MSAPDETIVLCCFVLHCVAHCVAVVTSVLSFVFVVLFVWMHSIFSTSEGILPHRHKTEIEVRREADRGNKQRDNKETEIEKNR